MLNGLCVLKLYFYLYCLMINNKSSSNFQFTANLTNTFHSQKLGVTTTVKEQVQNIENAIEHFKSMVDTQKKQQSELQIHLKKLQEKTHRNFNQLLNQITERSALLTNAFRHQNDKQSKQFQYIELQNSVLTSEHQKMHEISNDISITANELQNKVGV